MLSWIVNILAIAGFAGYAGYLIGADGPRWLAAVFIVLTLAYVIHLAYYESVSEHLYSDRKEGS